MAVIKSAILHDYGVIWGQNWYNRPCSAESVLLLQPLFDSQAQGVPRPIEEKR